MESNRTSSQSGSIVINSPNVSEFNNTVDKNKNGVIPSEISTSNSSLNFDDGGDDEGFVSGGEEFETASERPIAFSGAVDDKVVVAPKVFVKMPVAVVIKDEVEKDEEVRVLGGGGEVGVNGSSVENVIEPNLVEVESETSEVFADCDEVKLDEVPTSAAYVGPDEEAFDVFESQGVETSVASNDVGKVEEALVLKGDDVAVDEDVVATGSGSVEKAFEPDASDGLNLNVIGDEKVEAFAGSNLDKEKEVPELDTLVILKGDEIEDKKVEVLKSEVSEPAVGTDGAKVEIKESEPAVVSVNLSGERNFVVQSVQVGVAGPGVVVVGGETEVSLESPVIDSIVDKTEVEALEPENSNVPVKGDMAKAVDNVDVVEIKEKEPVNMSYQISPVAEMVYRLDNENPEELAYGSNQTSHADNIGDSEASTNKIFDVAKSELLDVDEKELEAEFIKQMDNIDVIEVKEIVLANESNQISPVVKKVYSLDNENPEELANASNQTSHAGNIDDSKTSTNKIVDVASPLNVDEENLEAEFIMPMDNNDVVEVKEEELANESNQISPADKNVNSFDNENSEESANVSNQTSHAENIGDSETSTNKIVDVAESEPLDVDEKELEVEAQEEIENADDGADMEELDTEEETDDGMIFGGSAAAKQFLEELERETSSSRINAESSREIDGQLVTDSEEEEEETDGEGGDEKEVFDAAAFAELLKAATGGGGSDGGNITITSQDGSRLFSIERPAGLGSTVRSSQPFGSRVNRSTLFAPPTVEPEKELSESEKKKLDSLQKLRVKFLRLVQRLGVSWDESVASQVLYRLALVAGRPNNQAFSLDAAKKMALELEAEEKNDLDFLITILVIGKCGVGKSSTINSIFGEEKTKVGAFEPGTTSVREINGVVDGVKIKVIDTPGLKSAVMEQAFNRKVLSSVKSCTKKGSLDIVLYVDRLDTQTRDLNDLPLLKTITAALGQPIWRSAIVTLTHGASAPPDGPSGNPLNYEVSVTQRSHVVQQSIGHAMGDLRMMSPSLMNPVSLVENHPMCRKNRDGQKVLLNGQTWRPQLLLLCYSMKILAEANSVSKPQDSFDHRKLFGFRARSPPLPYLLSSMLQSRAHPKLSSDQGIDNGDSDDDMADFSDSDDEKEEDEYDQLPPFKPLRKAQIEKLSKEQRKAYFEEFDYRVKLLQKKQWREEVRRVKEMKKREKTGMPEYDPDQEMDAPAPVATPLPDMVLPNSFDSDNPAYRYRFLEPTSQFLARPVLDNHGWDHDCGYDGVNLEQSLAIASKFPAAISVQVTKDKKDFSIHLDSSVAAKHGVDGSTMAGFDIQNVGKQLAYIVRGETKFKKFKKNKTAAGVSVTFLGENVVTGLKVEDQIAFNKQWAMVGSAGTVRSQGDGAYGANFELQRREIDYPIGQVQSTYGLSLIRWRGDWALGFNSVAQFSIGRNSKVALRAGINNKMSGQITVKTSSSDHLSLALVAFLPVASAIYKKVWPAADDSYSIY